MQTLCAAFTIIALKNITEFTNTTSSFNLNTWTLELISCKL